MNKKLEEATTDMLAGKVNMNVIGDMILWSTGTIHSLRGEESSAARPNQIWPHGSPGSAFDDMASVDLLGLAMMRI